MQYDAVRRGVFLRRPNRFIAQVLIDGREETVHVKNTGRCRELLVPGAAVYLEESSNPARKTRYSLIAVQKRDLLINMDSQAPNAAAAEALAAGIVALPEFGGLLPGIRREAAYGASRFDFLLERGICRAFVEVKGVTLEEEGAVLFPDAPTQRGIKHLEELCRARREGYACAVLFVIQMERAAYFAPNNRTHPQFGRALLEARQAGVHLLARRCRVTPDSMALLPEEVEIRLG